MNKVDTNQTEASQLRNCWALDQSVAYLNHGSFGACPTAVLDQQRMYRDQLEAEPVQFLTRNAQPLLDASRQTLGGFLGANPDDIAFVANATGGVNAVLRSLEWEAGDELLVTDHAYNACRNVLDWIAHRTAAKVVVVHVPFPVESSDQVLQAITQKVTSRTRIALIDHVTSISALVMPIKKIVVSLQQQGVDVLVDGAHAPGMVPLNVQQIGAAYYAGNCHKWLCAPKGAGFVCVRPDRQDRIVPTVVSHGYNKQRKGSTRFHDLFDWCGTVDPTPWLCVGHAIEYMRSLLPGGWQEVMQRNSALAFEAQQLLVKQLGIESPVPRGMLGSIATVPIPPDPTGKMRVDEDTVPTPAPVLQAELLRQYQIEVPIQYWPAGPDRVLRISAQLYNDRDQYVYLCKSLSALLEKEMEMQVSSNNES